MRKTIPVDKLLQRIYRNMSGARKMLYLKSSNLNRVQGELNGYKTVIFVIECLQGNKHLGVKCPH